MAKDKKILVDKDTGEVLYEVRPEDSLQLITPERRAAIQKAKQRKYANDEVKVWNEQFGGFIFVLFQYCDLILNEHPQIINADITKLFYLATYVDYEGYLVVDGRYVSRQQVKELLKISQRQFDTFFKKLTDANIIEYSDDCVKINTSYFRKGELSKDIKINYNYSRIYINTIRYLYDNVKVSKHNQLGLYFKLIPYIHRQRNVLCHNPDSRIEDVKLMNARELKEITGYHRNGVRKFINSLLATKLKNGESILVTVRNDPDEGKSYMLINPKVMYGGNFYLKDGKETIMRWFR